MAEKTRQVHLGWSARVRQSGGVWGKSHAIVVTPVLGARVGLACRASRGRGAYRVMGGPVFPPPGPEARCAICVEVLS